MDMTNTYVNEELARINEVGAKLADLVSERLTEKGTVVDFHTNEDFHKWVDERLDNRTRKLMVNLFILYAAPLFLGGMVMYSKLDRALEENEKNTVALYSRGQFIRDQQDFNCRMVAYEVAQHGALARDLLPCRFQSADDPRDVRR